jgi:hypothetical protein
MCPHTSLAQVIKRMYDVRRPMTDPLNILQVNVRDRSCAACPIGALLPYRSLPYRSSR